MILGANGEKMSKSRGNVVNPDDVIREFGADTLRVYEMFIGAFDQAVPWSTQGVAGCRRFLERVWRLQDMICGSKGISDALRYDVHACIKKVTEDVERMKFNTAIAAMMTLVNAYYAAGSVTRGEMSVLLTLLSPFAPHIAEEMWESLALGGEAWHQKWPKWDPKALELDEVEIALQVGGRVRGRIMMPSNMTREEGERTLPDHPAILDIAAGRPIRKLVFVPGRIVNLVIE